MKEGSNISQNAVRNIFVNNLTKVGQYLPADLNADYLVDVSDLALADNNARNFIGKITPLNSASMEGRMYKDDE